MHWACFNRRLTSQTFTVKTKEETLRVISNGHGHLSLNNNNNKQTNKHGQCTHSNVEVKPVRKPDSWPARVPVTAIRPTDPVAFSRQLLHRRRRERSQGPLDTGKRVTAERDIKSPLTTKPVALRVSIPPQQHNLLDFIPSILRGFSSSCHSSRGVGGASLWTSQAQWSGFH